MHEGRKLLAGTYLLITKPQIFTLQAVRAIHVAMLLNKHMPLSPKRQLVELENISISFQHKLTHFQIF